MPKLPKSVSCGAEIDIGCRLRHETGAHDRRDAAVRHYRLGGRALTVHLAWLLFATGCAVADLQNERCSCAVGWTCDTRTAHCVIGGSATEGDASRTEVSTDRASGRGDENASADAASPTDADELDGAVGTQADGGAQGDADVHDSAALDAGAEDSAMACPACDNDACPSDPVKTAPGVCGCGVPDVDSDGDGTYDCSDECPTDANKTKKGACGCSVADTDSDGDGVANCQDLCPNDTMKVDPGTCGCGMADTDSDRDGVANCKDGCPNDAEKVDPGTCGCGVAEGSCGGSTTSQCVRADEGSTVQIVCPAGSTLSSVGFSSYGTPTGTCGSFAVSSCNAQSSRTVVEATCIGKASCAVPATNAVFGDPCPGTRKLLAVEFTCGLSPGLKRAHYTGVWGALPDFTQLTPDVQDIIGTVALGSYTGTDGFGLVFTGKVRIGAAGSYDFELASDDGSRLLIDGVPVVLNDGLHSFQSLAGTATLSEGFHDMRLEYFELAGDENIRLRYRPTGGTLIEMPPALLFH